MEKKVSDGAIRLTNKTALALRRAAQKEHRVFIGMAAAATLLMIALGIVLGLNQPAAAFICVVAAGALDALILFFARSRYLLLTGQAICTEAAARTIRRQSHEHRRRQQADEDIARIKADVAAAALGEKIIENGVRPFFESIVHDDDEETERDLEAEREDAEDDLLPERKKRPVPRAASVPSSVSTATIIPVRAGAATATAPVLPVQQVVEPEEAPRRRRRPAPLTVIRGD